MKIIGAAFAAVITNATSHAAEAQLTPPAGQPNWTVGAEVGLTTGAGANLEYRFADHWAGIGAVGAGAWSGHYTIDTVDYNMKLSLLNEQVGLKWYPWGRDSRFFLNGGLFLNQSEFKGTVDNTGNSGTFLTVTPATAFGNLTTKITPMPASPYLSLGYGIFLNNAHTWKLGGEVGAYYTSWDVQSSRSDGLAFPQLDAVLAAHKQAVQDKMNDYPVLPIVKLEISYSF